MTIDRFERRMPEILTEISAPRVPDYIDDILSQTARTRQRPGWTLPERWLPMDITARPAISARIPWRTVAIVALLILALAVALVGFVGLQRRTVAPLFGPAANGSIIYDADGTIFVADASGGVGRPLITNGFGQRFSHDGDTIYFARPESNAWRVMKADADGGNVRPAAAGLLPATESAAVSPDERELAVILTERTPPALAILSLTEDGQLRTLDTDDVRPTQYVAWRPPTGRELVFLGHSGADDAYLGLYAIRPDGTGLRTIDLQHGTSTSTRTVYHSFTMSDDGSTGAYHALEPGLRPDKECYVHLIGLDTGLDRRMVYDPIAWCELDPTFLADGRLVMVTTKRADASEASLLIAAADGRTPGTTFDGVWTTAGRGWTLSPDRSKALLVTDTGTSMVSLETGAVESTALRIDTGDWSWQRLAR